MEAKNFICYNRVIPFKGFRCINLFGVLFARKEQGKLSKEVLQHEYIHTLQMRELGYLPFYILYLLEWLLRVIFTHSFKKAYYNISFEQEAYTFQKYAEYPTWREKWKWCQFLNTKEAFSLGVTLFIIGILMIWIFV